LCDTAQPRTASLSLHDALPIWVGELDLVVAGTRAGRLGVGDRGPVGEVDPAPAEVAEREPAAPQAAELRADVVAELTVAAGAARSEEHTSELQSRVDLVCRLLL